MFPIDTDALSKIRLNYGDQSAEGGKMLEDELIDFSEDQDEPVKSDALSDSVKKYEKLFLQPPTDNMASVFGLYFPTNPVF